MSSSDGERDVMKRMLTDQRLPAESSVDQQESRSTQEPEHCRCMPMRFVIVGLVFVGMVIINAMRTNIGVTVLTILDKEGHGINNYTGEYREIPSVDWDTFMIGLLQSIFYVGYLLTNLPGAYLTTRLPAHALWAASILFSCLLNLTLPVAMELAGFETTMVVRFSQGLSEGLLYPACYGILRHWVPHVERGRLGSFVFTGAYVGPILGFPVAGFITDYMGWEYIYYTFGGIGVVYVLIWIWISQEKPSHHKLITQDELNFLEEMMGSDQHDYEGVPIPWRSILTSLPVLTLCVCHFARNWVFILMLTNEPFFLNVFHFSISQNGVYSALPHLFKMSASFASGYIADWLQNKEYMTITRIRKLLTSGFGVQALAFVLLTLNSDGTYGVIFLCIAVGFGGFVVSGWQINHYDLSARYASVLVGVTSLIGNVASISAPLLAGSLTKDKTFNSWKEVFYITAGITALACVTFLSFGSGEKQPWAIPTDTSQLVVKQDKKRRHHKNIKGSKDNSIPAAFTYSHLHDDVLEKESDRVPVSIPNYGSQQTTSLTTPGQSQAIP